MLIKAERDAYTDLTKIHSSFSQHLLDCKCNKERGADCKRVFFSI